MSENSQQDAGRIVLVLGGGPAGVIAAVRLADLGHHVTLINRTRPGEGLQAIPNKVREQLRSHGLEASADTFGPLVECRTVWQGAETTEQLHVVHRRLLDQALLYDATRRHVHVVEGTAGGIRRTDSGWRVGVGEYDYEADFLVEARGREAGAAAGEQGVICLAMRYRMPADYSPFVAVTCFGDGWARFIAAERREAAVQVYLSGGKSDLPVGPIPRKKMFGGLAEELTGIWPLLAEATPRGEVERSNAFSRLREPLIGMDSIRIGEAALALEPLPGFTLEQSLETVEMALPVIESWLRGAGDKQQLAEGYSDRVRALYETSQRAAKARFGR
ncbi:NAD(P)/FAD-dependent oxidoreductase [Emcibacter nanhaiensis]|uniref:NAD(P)/FAD-dependent oxidoreductase n=1 Tax=Emcibacter nanhaiensis TaxID=1505037 RepID=UPI0015E470FC|nr:FAD-dependent oxidoreductase [Emcibacter nanhaiensis]